MRALAVIAVALLVACGATEGQRAAIVSNSERVTALESFHGLAGAEDRHEATVDAVEKSTGLENALWLVVGALGIVFGVPVAAKAGKAGLAVVRRRRRDSA